MSKVTEFLDKVLADEAARAEFDAVIGVRKERELNDGDFQKIVELSEKLGAAVTLDEVKDFFSGNGRELSEEELAGVAGGLGGSWEMVEYTYCCPLCEKEIYRSVPIFFRDGEAEADADYYKRTAKNAIFDHLISVHMMDSYAAQKKAEEMLIPDWENFISHWVAATAPR